MNTSTTEQNIQALSETSLEPVNIDYDFENNMVIVGSSNKICNNRKELKCKAVEQDMDVEELNLNELYRNDVASNDSDSNNSFSIISEESSCDESLISEGLVDTEFSNATIVINDDYISCASDMEIFKENNNDSNDNLDSVQSYQKEINLSLEDPDNIKETEIVKSESNSVPVYSKYSDIQTKIKKEVLQIHNLLPQFSYKKIYNVLNKNKFEENRVMLSLWDLLPYKRPQSKSKKKNNHLRTVNNFEQNKKEINKNLDEEHVLQLKQEAILTKSNNQSTQNKILRKAKLVLDSETCGKQVTSYENDVYSLKKNVFQSNSRNTTIVDNKQIKCGPLDNYMQYLSSIRSIKKDKLSKNFTFPEKHHTHKNISQYTNKNNKLKTLNISNIHCNTYDAEKCSQIKKIKNSSDMLNVEIVDLTEDNESFQNLYKDAVSTSTSLEIASTSMKSQNSHTNSSHDTSIQEVTIMASDPICSAGSNNQKNSILSTQLSVKELHTDLDTERSQFVVTVPGGSILLPTSTNDKRFDPSSSTGSNSLSSSSQIFKDLKRKENNIQKTDNQSTEYLQIYKELKSMFPEINNDLINDTYLKFVKMKTFPAEILQNMVEYILENVGICSLKKLSKCVCEDRTCDINKQVVNLSCIFPKADVTYLRKVVQSLKGDENAIVDFIQTQCKNPTYITKEETLKNMKIIGQVKQYTSNFDIEQFLQIFPNPFEYFENPNRICEYKADVCQLLQFYFMHLEETTVLLKYTGHKYNLSLTVQALEEMETDACLGRFIDVWKINLLNDIPLLQECAFITYKEQIKDYMNKKEEQRIRDIEELKKSDRLVECQCCYDNECLPFKCITCKCGHLFCDSCIIKGVEIKLAKGDTRISCFLECNEEFGLIELQNILPPTEFSILISKKQEEEVMAAGLSGLVSCPFCPFASIPPPEDKVFKCLNPECLIESCRLCKQLEHLPLKCYEEKTDKARLVLEEKMTEALVRKCYKCAKPYFKEDGCNKINCLCGATMCYICDKQIKGYDHFDNGGCPLNSDNRTLNADTVDAVAEKTLKYLIEKDPNVQLDPSTFLSRRKPSKTSNAAYSKRVTEITKFDI